MKRVGRSFSVKPDKALKARLLSWAQDYEHFAFLDSNSYRQSHGTYEAILAVGCLSRLAVGYPGAFDALAAFRKQVSDWIFGYMGYDLKNDIEDLDSKNFDGTGFEDLYFFQPERLLLIQPDNILFLYPEGLEQEIDSDYHKIFKINYLEILESVESKSVSMHLRTSRERYFDKVGEVLGHIERGDIYEMNFCQEVYAEDVLIHPLSTFLHLNAISRSPFASMLKMGHRFVMSASPERYLRKKGNLVWSQPIKGTAGREASLQEDQLVAIGLAANPKERSENIMITDLVRNDLSRIAVRGTVRVEELCRVYTFEQVHQLISTISCEVPDGTDPVEIVKATFPMGSMTGAPKVSAMKIIEELEDNKRGVYSGAIGYFEPTGDFDLNVVIRSILYNQASRYLSYSVGGAITAASVAEKEYEECLIKAKAMREVLEGEPNEKIEL